jgi:hypothetical protein
LPMKIWLKIPSKIEFWESHWGQEILPPWVALSFLLCPPPASWVSHLARPAIWRYQAIQNHGIFRRTFPSNFMSLIQRLNPLSDIFSVANSPIFNRQSRHLILHETRSVLIHPSHKFFLWCPFFWPHPKCDNTRTPVWRDLPRFGHSKWIWKFGRKRAVQRLLEMARRISAFKIESINVGVIYTDENDRMRNGSESSLYDYKLDIREGEYRLHRSASLGRYGRLCDFLFSLYNIYIVNFNFLRGMFMPLTTLDWSGG